MVKALSDPLRPGIFLCLQLPGNNLPFFANGNGILTMPMAEKAVIGISVTDNRGNMTTKKGEFYISDQESKTANKDQKKPGINAELYEPMVIGRTEKGKKLNRRIQLTPPYAVFKKPVTLTFGKIKKLKIPPEKLVFGKVQPDGTISPLSSRFEKDALTGRVNSGGTYGIAVDTVAPRPGIFTFAGYDFYGNLLYETAFNEHISGLRSVSALLDGSWVLSEFYSNRNVIILTIPPDRLPGKHTLVLQLEDRCSNRSETSFFVEKPGSLSGQ
jgi:hypothetical protein